MGIGVLGDFVFRETNVKKRLTEESKLTNGTLFGLIWRPVVVAVFLILLAGLLRVQIFQGAYFRALADGNRIRRVPIHAPRGVIYDRNKVPLVVNLPSYRLKTCPAGDSCDTSLISKSQAIELQAKGLSSGQSLELDSTRSYPYGPATAHVLGYVSQISAQELLGRPDYLPGDVVGRGGLEQQYESELRGKNGEEVAEVDATGEPIRVLSTVFPEAGRDIYTNIDINVAKTAYEQIKSQIGAAVVTDPLNGAVIALASSPSFDPNVFTDLSLPAEYRALKIKEILSDPNQPLFDRAISGTYPAGSTFKIVTATAGLETGKITGDTQIEDPGILVIGPYKFPNWLFLRGGGTQGIINVVSAIAKSNDIFFYRVGEWVGVDDLAKWALKFGLAAKLGIDLPGESAGSFPTKAWRDQYAASWYLGDTYHLAIGQGDLLVTPLQVNRWTSVIANEGKLCIPRVGQPFGNSQGKQESRIVGSSQCKPIGISQKNLDLVKQGMVAACSPGGTAWPLFDFKVKSAKLKDRDTSNQFPVFGIQIACKTGTAEFGDPKERTHAWLTGYAPADKPEIAATVIIEGGGEGDMVAAPMVKKILETWFQR